MAKKVHPVAELFPLLDEAGLEALATDIGAHGLLEPILLHPDGRVIDGRNRLEACRRAGVEPRFRTHDGPDDEDDLTRLVLSLNLHRRHLNESQRAAIADTLATRPKGRPSRRENSRIQLFSQAEAAKLLNVGVATVKQARTVRERGTPELVAAVARGEVSLNKAATRLPPAPAVVRASREGHDEWDNIALTRWKALDAATRHRLLNLDPAEVKVPGMTEQTGEDIGWARWSLNPITGCLHPCLFCYARDIAESKRMAPYYPHGFAPAIRPRHFLAPLSRDPPPEAERDVSLKNVFVGSMADNFGRWVPDEWTDRLTRMCREAPRWNFLFLTKFPKRLAEIDFPPNAWVGTSVIEQKMVPAAEKAFGRIRERQPDLVTWLSVEPMLEPITFGRLDLFRWVVIGGASPAAETAAWTPSCRSVHALVAQAWDAGCAVYQKTNLAGGSRVLEMPGGLPVRQDPGGDRAPENMFPRGAVGRRRQPV